MHWFCFLLMRHPEFAEADSFYCLQALFSFEIRDFFLKSLDDSGSGIKQKMAQLSQLLKLKDPEVYERLEQQNLYPQYYSFRWLTLILSQEFPLPDVVRIWDSVFADENRFDFLVRICCAMIVWVKWNALWSSYGNEYITLQLQISTDCFGRKYFKVTSQRMWNYCSIFQKSTST